MIWNGFTVMKWSIDIPFYGLNTYRMWTHAHSLRCLNIFNLSMANVGDYNVHHECNPLKPKTRYEPRYCFCVDLIKSICFALVCCLIGIGFVDLEERAFKIRIQRSLISVIDFSVCLCMFMV